MGFRAYWIEKIWALIGVHYQLHNNVADYLKSFRTNSTFLNPNLDEVYDRTTGVLYLILLILSSWKLANLPHPWLFLQSNPFFSPK